MHFIAAASAFSVTVCTGVVFASGPRDVAPLIEQAVQAAVTVAEATTRVDVQSVRLPTGCKATSARLDRAVAGSGSLTVSLQGIGKRGVACEGWARATVLITAPVMVTTRVVRTGELLDAATTVEWREIGAGAHPAPAAIGGIAARTLMAGTVVDASSVRSNKPSAGSQVRVSIEMGALKVEQIGRLIPCGGDRACAVLPSGKRVEGALEDDRLVVMVP